ncbi:hypothetical protein QCA50_007349 [Cerrena zonata]|uniref:Protein kinase domain-containing protein n=1 Tax=Cerrena zonata TaxID=2478898 RepID=A0AAW0GAU5_9APHY
MDTGPRRPQLLDVDVHQSSALEPYDGNAMPMTRNNRVDPHIFYLSDPGPGFRSFPPSGFYDNMLNRNQRPVPSGKSYNYHPSPHRSILKTRDTQASGNLHRDISPTQSDVDLLFKQLLESRVDASANTQSLTLLSILRRKCNDLGKLPSTLYLDDVRFPGSGWPQAIEGGSFSDVYMALKGESKVALKVLRIHQNNDEKRQKTLRKRFLSEVLLWASCNHEYVLPFLGVDTANFPHGLCMVLPWMKHGKVLCKLRLWRKQKDPIAIKTQVDEWVWIVQIAKGLAYLHTLGIIHGDLRAANILLDENYNIKLADFGLSLVADDIVTQATTIERTPNWIAPELVNPEKFGRKSSKPTLAGDVYAFGCVTIELYTGNPPYPGLQSYQVIKKIMAAEPIPRPAFYNEPQMMGDCMWNIVERCLRYDPIQRPSASDIPGWLVTRRLYISYLSPVCW